jgi:hypothetical protein
MAPAEENEQFSVPVLAEMSDNALGCELFDEERCLRPRSGQKIRRTAQREELHAPLVRLPKKSAAVFSFALCSREMQAGNQVFGGKLAPRPLVEEHLFVAPHHIQAYPE